MNFFSMAPALIVAAGVSFTAIGDSSQRAPLSEARVSQIHQSLSQAKLVEAPKLAAHLVMAASKEERSTVTRAVVEEVLTSHPTSISATVRAVLTVAPEEVVAVMEAVMDKAPKAYATALVVVLEMNPGLMASAGSVVSTKLPEETSTVKLFADGASQLMVAQADFAGSRLSRNQLQAIIKSLIARINAAIKANNFCLLSH